MAVIYLLVGVRCGYRRGRAVPRATFFLRVRAVADGAVAAAVQTREMG